MTDTPTPPPGRSALSLAVLLGLVLAITAQLVTGFLLWSTPGPVLLGIHLAGGLAATVLLVAEWSWLLGSAAGRVRLTGFFGRGAGLAGWTDGLFMLCVTVAVGLGLVLAGVLRGGFHLPYSPLLSAHRDLALAVVALYLVHGVTAARKRARRMG